MRVAFDLDQTLIAWNHEFPSEPAQRRWHTLFFRESLRNGTISLLRELHSRGIEICIYTPSLRGPQYLRTWFLLQGIPIRTVINREGHDREARRRSGAFPEHCTKYPPAFDIDLLIDDSEGVAEEGRRYGFAVLVIDPADLEWTQRVLDAIDRHCRR
jgi:hypothetical protein